MVDGCPPAPEVSVVMAVKNSASTIAEQLEALSRQTFDGRWELVVAEHGSTDGTGDIVRLYQQRIVGLRIVDASHVPPGPGPARNVGIRHARGEILCFCDGDDVVADDWLAALVACTRAHPLVAGALELDSLNDDDVRGRSPIPEAAWDDANPRWAGTCNMGAEKRLFDAIGVFDETYLKSQDVELSMRAKRAGFDVAFCPHAVVAYRLRTTLKSVWTQGYRTGYHAVQHYRDGNRPARSRRALARSWWWIARHLPFLLRHRTRGVWVRKTAEAIGRIAGSWAFRTRYF